MSSRRPGMPSCPVSRAARHGSGVSYRWLQLIVLALTAACAACSGAVPRQAIPDYSRFSHVWKAPHITLYWDCTEGESGSLRIEGVGVNEWEPVPPEFLDLNLFGLDAQGRVLSQVRGSAQGAELIKNFPEPFRLELREQGGEVRVAHGFIGGMSLSPTSRPVGRREISGPCHPREGESRRVSCPPRPTRHPWLHRLRSW